MFRQKMYDILLDWKSRFQSRTAMMVEGARCVGKSTVVEEFARREYRSYILVDFAEASRDVHELFDDVSDLDYLFLQLQLRYSARLLDRELLIILDEVQMCLRVRQAIKQLVKDGRYDYIGTGSLVSIRRNTRDILIPSEEKRAQMRPMDFDEFRWARGDDATVPLLRRAFASRRPLGERFNRRLMRDFRLYMLVGGMPQAVDALLRTNDPSTGLSSSIDLGKFKLYLADTGLFVTLAFKDADFTDNIVYGKLLSDKLPVGLGMVYENVVAQELTAHGRRLFYHTWPKPGTTRNYEIDFIVPDGKKVSPVEVKSSNYRTHASLDAFCGKYSSRVGRRYLVYTKDLDRDGPSTASDLHVRVPIGRGTVCISSNRGGRLGLVSFVGLLDQEESPLWRSTAGNNATESWICASNTNTAPLTSYRIR